MMLFWTILLLVIGVALLRLLPTNTSGDGPAHESPLDELRMRYARGELSEEEFEQMKDRINKS